MSESSDILELVGRLAWLERDTAERLDQVLLQARAAGASWAELAAAMGAPTREAARARHMAAERRQNSKTEGEG